MTKEVTKFPVKEISGTFHPDKERNYFAWRGIQVSRRYHAPKAPYNDSYNLTRLYQTNSKASWNALSTTQKGTWYEYAKAWNEQTGRAINIYNAYTGFSTVNLYRQIKGLALTDTPPTIRKQKSWQLLGCKGYSAESPFVLLLFQVDGLETNTYKVAIHTTTAYPGFTHAYRKSERKFIHGMSEYDIIEVPFKNGIGQYILTDRPERFPVGSHFWLEARLLSDEYFPFEEKRYNVEAISTMELFSVSLIDTWFPAEALAGCAVPDTLGKPMWHQSPFPAGWGIWTYGDGAKIRFPNPFPVWANLQKIIIRWGCGTSTPTLTMSWKYSDVTGTPQTEGTRDEVTHNCPTEYRDSELVYDLEDWIQTQYEFIECVTNNPTNQAFNIRCIKFQSSNRVY